LRSGTTCGGESNASSISNLNAPHETRK